MLVIIISSICGGITFLAIAIAVAYVKYGRWKRNRVTESNHAHDNNISLNETNSHDYEEMGEEYENIQGNNQREAIRQNRPSSQEPYQSLNVCDENSYLRINERPTIREDVPLEETNTSHYEQMRRSQIGNHEEAYQAWRDGNGGSENN